MILDGKKFATQIEAEIREEVSKLSFIPVFCDILVGDNPASAQYVRMKAKAAQRVGYRFRSANFPGAITTPELISEIKKINTEENLCGLIVQLPLPASLDRQAILDAIDPKIDVDCTGKINTDLFYQGKSFVAFPTAASVIFLIDQTGINYNEKQFLVLGQGQLVGKPVSFLLNQKGAKVNIATSKTPNTQQLISEADVVISAVGKANLITGGIIKPGAVIIDAGTSESDGGIVGDVDFESVKDKASFLSPVPGGVGPLTVAMLLKNVLISAKQKL